MKLLFKIFISFLILFSVPTLAHAATYYVSTIGSNGNSGTQSLPWKTIQHAADTMVAGDTGIVLAGTYNEQLNITASGITLQAEGKVITEGVYISGNSNTFRGFTITDPTSDWGIRTSGDHNLVENNEIYGTKQDGIWFFGSYNTFRGNYIHDILYSDSAPQTHTDCFQTWSWDWDTTNVLFENNTCINSEVVNTNNEFCYIERNITRLKPDGITAEVRDITFRNNVLVIYRPIWAGLGWGEINNITIENNTIINMGQNGQNNVVAYIGPTQNNISFINNLFINWGGTNSYQPYIPVDGGTNISIHNNDIYNYNGIPPYKEVHPGDLWMIDPKIVSLSGLDFHLQSNSPLIDAGYNLGSLVPNDFDGVARPQGAGYDIGAYEFVSGTLPSPTLQPTPTPTPTPSLTPTPVIKPGDANEDGQVNETDFTIWLSHFGQTVSGFSNGDFNGDGRVDGIDYTVWLNNYGK